MHINKNKNLPYKTKANSSPAIWILKFTNCLDFGIYFTCGLDFERGCQLHIKSKQKQEKMASNQVEVQAQNPQVQVQAENPQQLQQAIQAIGTGNDNQFVSASLYVGDLEPSVSDGEIYDLFQQIGLVHSVRVCRDAITDASLGYAYVNYNNAENATTALSLLNFTRLHGKPIRIMYSHRDPILRRCGSANIFIKNIDKVVDDRELYDTFRVFGPIYSSKIATDTASGRSKGYGFVHFEQEEAAQNAIEHMNGMLIRGKQVYVGPFKKKQERGQTNANENDNFRNVFVKNLSESLTDEDLRNYFGVYGTITSVIVMRDAEGKSKGFGFVNFENAEDAANCVQNLNGKKIGGKECYVEKARNKSESRGRCGRNLYVKNLDDSIDDEKLREMFSGFGTITSCKVMRDSHGHSKGFGFVAFASPDEASRALAEMKGKMVLSKSLYVSLAQRKDERRAWLQAHFSHLENVNADGMAPPVPGLNQQVIYGRGPVVPARAPGLNHGQGPAAPGQNHQQVINGQRPPVPARAPALNEQIIYSQGPVALARAPRLNQRTITRGQASVFLARAPGLNQQMVIRRQGPAVPARAP